MRVGIVTKWFNRGQPVVGRYIRSAFEALGHETFVLAKPRREKGPKPRALERSGIWDQPRVTEASSFATPLSEYLEWARQNSLDLVHCDQNYQFDELAELRRQGVRVIGRFVWEHFAAEHLEGARKAYDIVYSVTECEQRRYAGWGMETPRVPWGIHPELLAVPIERPDDGLVRFVFPGGFIGHRKPLEPVVEAFAQTGVASLRLLVKAQVERDRLGAVERLIADDTRITLHLADDPWQQHLRIIAGCDVCITPSRWEGLGLPLYEATAFGQPIISNDDPPMNEVVRDGVNGLLVASRPDGTARSGIAARRLEPAALAATIERLADPSLRAELAAGAARQRTELSWDRTIAALGALL